MGTIVVISVLLTILAITLLILGTLFLVGTFNTRGQIAAEKLRNILIAIFKFLFSIIKMPIKTWHFIKNSSNKKKLKLLSLFLRAPIRLIRFLNHKNGH